MSSTPPVKINPVGIDAVKTYAVQSMFNASASVHSTESEYEIFIFNNDILSVGEYVKMDCATLTDCALIGTTVEVSGDKFTSEGYYPAPLFDIENEPVVRFYDNSGLYKPVGVVSPGAALTRVGVTYWVSGEGITVASTGDPDGNTTTPLVKPSYTFDLSSITFPTSSTQMAFSIDYSMLVNGEDCPIHCLAGSSDHYLWCV